MREIWKDIKGYEGRYMISNLGNVLTMRYKGKGKAKQLKPYNDEKGYFMVSLYNNKKIKTKRIHEIVAKTFILNPDNLPQVNHIDGNKHNNRIDNLEWCTSKENIRHAWKNGLMKSTKGRKRKNLKHNFLGYKAKKSKSVAQYSLDGEYINTWKSINEAARNSNISAGNIHRCCMGEFKQTGGYIWKFVEFQ